VRARVQARARGPTKGGEARLELRRRAARARRLLLGEAARRLRLGELAAEHLGRRRLVRVRVRARFRVRARVS
jgi:hypothetical protein